MSQVLIVGASRGIGLEFVRQYRAAGEDVVATVRHSDAAARVQQLGATALELDVADAGSALRFAGQVKAHAFDTAVICAGVYGPRTDGLQPPAQDDFDAVMRTNVLGPMRVVAALSGALAPAARVAVISSLMGAIGPRTSCGGWLYRASKAAVNSVVKDASIALGGRAICVSFHPGWVRTDMGGAGATLDACDSVADMRRVIAALRPDDNGRFFNHDGTPIPW